VSDASECVPLLPRLADCVALKVQLLLAASVAPEWKTGRGVPHELGARETRSSKGLVKAAAISLTCPYPAAGIRAAADNIEKTVKFIRPPGTRLVQVIRSYNDRKQIIKGSSKKVSKPTK